MTANELDEKIEPPMYRPDGYSRRHNSDTTMSVLMAATARAICGIADATTTSTPAEASVAAPELARHFGD